MSFGIFRGGAKVKSLLIFRGLTSLLTSHELSEAMGKTEFSSTTKYRTNSVSYIQCILQVSQ